MLKQYFNQWIEKVENEKEWNNAAIEELKKPECNNSTAVPPEVLENEELFSEWCQKQRKRIEMQK